MKFLKLNMGYVKRKEQQIEKVVKQSLHVVEDVYSKMSQRELQRINKMYNTQTRIK